jgi:hypothetical protein
MIKIVMVHVTSKIILLFVTYLLEDEQELSLGMLIRCKRIYNFWCSILVYTNCYMFYLHFVALLWFIWTNLLIVACHAWYHFDSMLSDFCCSMTCLKWLRLLNEPLKKIMHCFYYLEALIWFSPWCFIWVDLAHAYTCLIHTKLP